MGESHRVGVSKLLWRGAGTRADADLAQTSQYSDALTAWALRPVIPTPPPTLNTEPQPVQKPHNMRHRTSLSPQRAQRRHTLDTGSKLLAGLPSRDGPLRPPKAH